MSDQTFTRNEQDFLRAVRAFLVQEGQENDPKFRWVDLNDYGYSRNQQSAYSTLRSLVKKGVASKPTKEGWSFLQISFDDLSRLLPLTDSEKIKFLTRERNEALRAYARLRSLFGTFQPETDDTKAKLFLLTIYGKELADQVFPSE
jgi:hypothetical protein